jgi:sulfopyruvate decarboxylase TPP-binding subunit
MLDGPTVVRAIEAAGFTHVVWVPDSHLGTWEDALTASRVRLVRPTREGEAVALAAGLMLGGARPLVAVQCTGFFEAGDAVRNAVHDLGLPLKLIVGVRGWRAHKVGKTADNCPRFAEPLVRAWGLPATWFDPFVANATGCELALRELAASDRAAALLWGE